MQQCFTLQNATKGNTAIKHKTQNSCNSFRAVVHNYVHVKIMHFIAALQPITRQHFR